jgi:hypothetical protein
VNTKRILSGGLLAGLVIFVFDYLLNHVVLGSAWHELYVSGYLQKVKPYTVPSAALLDLGVGFILMWLYALARPRLGPGPKTAIVMGSLGWFLFFVPRAFDQWMWYQVPSQIPAVYLIGGLLDCWIATYLAGWQYIERAP